MGNRRSERVVVCFLVHIFCCMTFNKSTLEVVKNDADIASYSFLDLQSS